MTLEAELSEIRRVGRMRRLLDLPVSIHDTLSPECRGECTAPKVVADHGLTCCHFYLAKLYQGDLAKYERYLKARIARGRQQLREIDISRVRQYQADKLDLAQRYPRWKAKKGDPGNPEEDT